MTIRIVAVLETMWGDRAGRAPRFFKISPKNNSGHRLYKLIGGEETEENETRLWVTNACRELVTSANQHGKPDPIWLAENLRRLNPDLILVCGKVAQKTFHASEYQHCKKACLHTIHIMHPAARCWSQAMMNMHIQMIARIIKGVRA